MWQSQGGGSPSCRPPCSPHRTPRSPPPPHTPTHYESPTHHPTHPTHLCHHGVLAGRGAARQLRQQIVRHKAARRWRCGGVGAVGRWGWGAVRGDGGGVSGGRGNGTGGNRSGGERSTLASPRGAGVAMRCVACMHCSAAGGQAGWGSAGLCSALLLGSALLSSPELDRALRDPGRHVGVAQGARVRLQRHLQAGGTAGGTVAGGTAGGTGGRWREAGAGRTATGSRSRQRRRRQACTTAAAHTCTPPLPALAISARTAALSVLAGCTSSRRGTLLSRFSAPMSTSSEEGASPKSRL